MGDLMVFISYRRCPRDAAVLDRLEVFFKPLEREGLICGWSDREIDSGRHWPQEINAVLERARVAILLISQDFLASDFISQTELPILLNREAKGTVTLLPLFVSPVDEDHRVGFRDENGISRHVRLTDLQGFAHPDRTLAEMPPAEQERIFKDLIQHIRTLASTASSAPIKETVPTVPQSRKTFSPCPPMPDGKDRSLTLQLTRSADSYTAHYWLADRDCGLLQRPWPEAQALIQAVDDAAGPQAPATGSLPPGDALFALLFGGETDWEPLFRTLFGYPEYGTRPNPTRGGVRLRLCSQAPLLLSLPWTLLSWDGRCLIDVGWKITTGSDVEPLRDCVTVPTGEFLVVWPGIAAAPAQCSATINLAGRRQLSWPLLRG